MLSPHRFFFLVFLFCLSGMAFALTLQHLQHIEPCPLCIFQRIALISAGIVSLIAGLHLSTIHTSHIAQRIYSVLLGLSSVSGAGIALRQVWIQHLPADQVPDCGPGLNYMLDVFPLQKVVSMVLRGSGECAKIDWTLFGFSLPEYSLLAFAGLFILSCWQFRQSLSMSDRLVAGKDRS